MRRLQVAIVDLVVNGPTSDLWNRLMEPNFASIIPQAVAVWCEEAGHAVTVVCYTGLEDLARELPSDTDLLFIGRVHERGILRGRRHQPSVPCPCS